jgi:hypothetical protein
VASIDNKLNGPLTIFGESETALATRFATARLDPAEFQRPLKSCGLTCHGMCCYGGVSVDDATAATLQQLAQDRAADFRALGLDLPTTVVAPTEWHGVVGNITALKPRAFRSLVPDFPAHFDETACVFLLDDARCGLQALAVQDGKHPWTYKPFSCWLHPVKLADGEIRVFDAATDPLALADYDGFVCHTQCGRTDPEGVPAALALTAELTFLGKILGRDLVAEAAAGDADAPTEDDGFDTPASARPSSRP